MGRTQLMPRRLPKTKKANIGRLIIFCEGKTEKFYIDYFAEIIMKNKFTDVEVYRVNTGVITAITISGGHWVDNGWWEFDSDQYSAYLRSKTTIQPDGKNPTVSGRTIKSGYGINQTTTADVSTNQSSAVTPIQTGVSYFPEFEYKTCWRLLYGTQKDAFHAHLVFGWALCGLHRPHGLLDTERNAHPKRVRCSDHPGKFVERLAHLSPKTKPETEKKKGLRHEKVIWDFIADTVLGQIIDWIELGASEAYLVQRRREQPHPL